MIEINYKEACEAMEEVFDDFKECKNCEHCEGTSDGYGTGDSPTLYECTASGPEDCFMVEEE